ncbi:MAG TPA: endonuclease [Candidatus Yaniella excrementigallinarum]|nr:endonuclease [Candidatus Yaniella excrementigallinarum]
MPKSPQTVETVLERFGSTFVEQAEISLKDKPAPLYQLLVLSTLLSARISSDIGVTAAKELSAAGFRTPQHMVDATWQQRVEALGRGHYRRFDESTATMLGDGAQLLLDDYSGDLRKLRDAAETTRQVSNRLQQFPGIGPTGAAIFLREVQGIWPDIGPYFDKKAMQGAQKVDLPTDAGELAELVDVQDLPRLAAGLVRIALDKSEDPLDQ